MITLDTTKCKIKDRVLYINEIRRAWHVVGENKSVIFIKSDRTGQIIVLRKEK